MRRQLKYRRIRMSKIIALDAGHGMKTAGKRCLKSIDPNETREWYLNDRIADIVEAELIKNYDCRVIRVGDTTGARDISLSSRVKAANTAKADIYISIHHDAGINGGYGGGVSVHYYGAGKGDRVQKAQRLYNAVVKRNGLIGNRSQKVVPSSGLYVLKHTTMAALLIENGFMDSTVDTPIILTKTHAEKTAQGIMDFLVAELNLVKKVKEPVEDITDKVVHLETYYPAYTGKNTILVSAMTSLGINSSYTFRKKIAAANGIKLYMGTDTQNILMYNLLKAGMLKRA